METSAGIAIIYQKKMLVVHPTNSPIFNSWSIPKGHVESGEEIIEAAFRETLEETGLKLHFNNINPDPVLVKYDKRGKIYKHVYCFAYEIRDLAEIGLEGETLPHDRLQLSEIDFGTFMDVKNLDKYLFWRLKPFVELIK